MAAVPDSGWKIATLPAHAAHLQAAWNGYPGNPTSSKGAWGQLLSFLKANKLRASLSDIYDSSIEQWCAPDPKRCKGYKKKGWPPKLPWAKKAWETANLALGDELDPDEVAATLTAVIGTLTDLIESPTGCKLCAEHWAQVRKDNPVPKTPTLDAARRYLWHVHNLTREGKEPVPFEVIAAKFNWTSPE